ncbi:hypothetical protein M8J76_002943 [Diaphorina citri]|nr:hypothetical protein M8J76_002943 [Diaphorina citri]
MLHSDWSTASQSLVYKYKFWVLIFWSPRNNKVNNLSTMGDDMNEMNPCECLFSHEMAMRRLLSFLRQSQTACTDTDCIDALPGLTNPTAPAGDNSFSIMLMMTMTALRFLPHPLPPVPSNLPLPSETRGSTKERNIAPELKSKPCDVQYRQIM